MDRRPYRCQCARRNVAQPDRACAGNGKHGLFDGRRQLQHIISDAGRRGSVRASKDRSEGQAHKARSILHDRGDPGKIPCQSAAGRPHTENTRTAQTAGHIYQRPARDGQSVHRQNTYLLQPDRHRHRPDIIDRSQSAEHTYPH